LAARKIVVRLVCATIAGVGLRKDPAHDKDLPRRIGYEGVRLGLGISFA